MILFGKTYDENSVSAKKGMTATWQKRHNPAKSYDNQFGKSYDVNLTFYSYDASLAKRMMLFGKNDDSIWENV